MLSDWATALQALLGSLTSEDGAKSSPDAAKKLSQKLEELVGGVASADLSRNERGDVRSLYQVNSATPPKQLKAGQ